MTIGVEAYISEDYARAERDKLWRKVWLQVGRVEEIPEVGNYLTYDILDDSIVDRAHGARQDPGLPQRVPASRPPARGHARRRAATPAARQSSSSSARYHGWRFDLDGENTHVPHKEDWKGALTDENTA